ncbi:uncharacterized protein BO87DRAFT_412972 [Aspergillus neoniger CBS 115656]|uniref:DEUBAD domain-containing protein n=1 Tax=Aspergillus neoniger (strain CBS 115656) TaxID=1448310 RepID=A0A318YV72_ASPNB|nr:hypothetical protein BO87DRAFT_412972 [Aspergillus neoniger CBS 115656]PYH38376.1 hypothetical protein BO87DRAFT_412972 [Aspergillus neoniger CBS 115656]
MPPSTTTTNTKPKRNPRRAAKDPWEEEKVMTSTKSPLVDADLVGLLANPKAWNCLEESEKQEIIKLLPDSVHPDPNPPTDDDADAKIPPPPQEFLRYSNNWREGIRQFQVELQDGFHDPEWLRQAELAMEERAAGAFDRFKEEEFEEFWGQKQKMDKTLLAGQSSQVKLKTLIDHNVVREGDVWKYSRCFSKGADRVLVEKEARIVGIKSARLNFVIPPGQRVFLPVASSGSKQNQSHADGTKADVEAGDQQQDSDAVESDSNVQRNTSAVAEPVSPKKRKCEDEHGDCKRQRSLSPEADDQQPDSDAVENDSNVQLNSSEVTQPMSPKKRKCEDEHGDCKRQRSQPPEADDQAASSSEVPKNMTEAAAETASPSTTAEAVSSAEVAEISTATSEKPDSAGEASDEPSVSVPEAPQESTEDTEKTPPANVSDANMDEILIENIQGLTSLASKIIEVDGRITDIPNGNAWKEFRAYRNNQDMGSLWELRQAWFQRAGK